MMTPRIRKFETSNGSKREGSEKNSASQKSDMEQSMSTNETKLIRKNMSV